MSLATDTTCPSFTERRTLAMVLIVAGLLRLGLIGWRPESLAEDRDLYWGIAERLAAGDGFQHPTLGHATAYRPPLYPLVLSRFISWGSRFWGMALFQTGLSLATVWLTWSLSRKAGLGCWSLIAAMLVAVNPLLIHVNSQAMTETVCTFLLIAMLWVADKIRDANRGERDILAIRKSLELGDLRLEPPGNESLIRPFALGLLCGLAALTRPTVFAFVMLAAAVEIVRQISRRQWDRTWCANALAATLTLGLTVAPWGLRNQHVFGVPIVTTTHGGYTLLLGNNEAAFQAEVAAPTGTLWDSRPWQQSLDQEMSDAGLKPCDEVRRDRYLSNKAWTWIRQNPTKFASACWLRIRRFWNISPSGTDVDSLPRTARWGMAAFFLVELSLAAIGLCSLKKSDWTRWWPIVLLIVSFAAVHVVYWSNLRMRAPIEPALALLAAQGVCSCWPRRDSGVDLS